MACSLQTQQVDEECAFNLRYFDLLDHASNDIPYILGSDTGCMTKVIYEWKPHREDW